MNGSKDSTQLIFLCVDGSLHSLRAFEWFTDHFYRQGQTVGIVHVHNPPVTPHNNRLADVESDYEDRLQDVMSRSTAVIQSYLNKCIEYNMKVKVFAEEKSESVGKTVCQLVKQHNPLCIVMGQRGLGVVKRTLYGSVSDYILHHAHIPLVVVPPPKDAKE